MLQNIFKRSIAPIHDQQREPGCNCVQEGCVSMHEIALLTDNAFPNHSAVRKVRS